MVSPAFKHRQPLDLLPFDQDSGLDGSSTHPLVVCFLMIHGIVGDCNSPPILSDDCSVHRDCSSVPVITRFSWIDDRLNFTLGHRMEGIGLPKQRSEHDQCLPLSNTPSGTETHRPTHYRTKYEVASQPSNYWFAKLLASFVPHRPLACLDTVPKPRCNESSHPAPSRDSTNPSA
jgi:hypothetical protein